MKIIHVITRLVVGGAQENTVATVLGLRQKSGDDVHLISGPTSGPEGSLETSLTAASPKQAEDRGNNGSNKNSILTVIPELVRPIHPWNDLIALRKLEKVFREQKPDVVHTHSGKAGILGRLAAKRAGVPAVVHTIHGPSFGNFQNALANFVFRAAERKAARNTDHFIVVADAMADQYLAAGIGSPGQYTKIFSGFPLQPFLTAQNDPVLRQQLGIAPGDFVIGKIARLFKLKGHDDLFAIAPHLVRLHPKIRFLLVGDGEWRGWFEKMADDSGLRKHFIFTGLVPPAEVPKYIGIMNMLVHLSLREGLPRALPQALASGKPVVAYDCDGAREICRDDETGFLVSPGDHDKLLACISLLAGNETLCRRLGQTGQDFVRENFAVEKMVDAIYTLYRELTAKLPSPSPRQTGRGSG